MPDESVQLGQDVQQLLVLLESDKYLKEFADGFHSRQELEELASRAKFRAYDSAGYKIFNQGDWGNEFFIVLSGQLRAIDMTNPERPHLVNYLIPGSVVGTQALFGNRNRTATVETVSQVKIAVFDENDWYWILNKNPRARALFESIEQNRIQQARKEFPGRQRDEVVVIATKRHFVAFLAKLPLPLSLMIAPIIFFLTAELLGLSSSSVALTMLPVLITLPFFLVAVLLIIYHYFDWQNDELIVTTKRVIHIERILFYGEQRRDAPLARVQDVFTVSDLFDYFFDSDSIRITTAGAGRIEIEHIRHASEVRDAILEHAGYAKARVAEADVTALQQNMANVFGAQHAIPKIVMAVAEPEWNEEEKQEKLTRHYNALVDYFIPRIKEVDKASGESTVITWRKHRFVLLANILWPTLLLIFLIYLLLIVVWLPLQILIALGILGTFFWYLWAYDDWYRDLYQVTDTHIIDIDSAAFRLRKTRRDGSFDKIQNVYTEVPNLFYKLLNMGNVIIETAAAGPDSKFTFKKVFDPSAVSQEIFHRWALFQQSEREKNRQSTNQEIMSILKEYHRLANRLQQE